MMTLLYDDTEDFEMDTIYVIRLEKRLIFQSMQRFYAGILGKKVKKLMLITCLFYLLCFYTKSYPAKDENC